MKPWYVVQVDDLDLKKRSDEDLFACCRAIIHDSGVDTTDLGEQEINQLTDQALAEDLAGQK